MEYLLFAEKFIGFRPRLFAITDDSILSRYGTVRFTYRPRRAAGLARAFRQAASLRFRAYRKRLYLRRDKDPLPVPLVGSVSPTPTQRRFYLPPPQTDFPAYSPPNRRGNPGS